jgi:hypothetical protein
MPVILRGYRTIGRVSDVDKGPVRALHIVFPSARDSIIVEISDWLDRLR